MVFFSGEKLDHRAQVFFNFSLMELEKLNALQALRDSYSNASSL